jgi:ABC-type multidrug transport system ATPase subunit
MSIKLSNIQISYSENPKPILNIGSLEFDSGINFIIGKNGSGKSTLIKALSNINNDIQLTGNIELEGKQLKEFNIGLVTQNPLQSINLELTFLENLLLASTSGYSHLSLTPQLTSSSSQKVIQFLQTFNNWNFLSELLHKEARNLSSGQQQMLAILMRVIRFQKLLLLDECTANLDADNTGTIIGILLELVTKGTIIIFATHQTELLQTVNSKSYKIENGTIKNQ